MTNWGRSLEQMLQGLEKQAVRAEYQPFIEDIGRVRSVGDGIAEIEGLNDAMLDEVVLFANGVAGQLLDLDRDVAGCVILGPETDIRPGMEVLRSGRGPATPVGPETLGRVMNPLGTVLDGLGEIGVAEWREVHQEAPPALQRQPVRQPLLTGIKAVDAAIPIGLGQRELILGDRETGKTSIALDAILNQRELGIICVYVSIGGKRSSVRGIVDDLRRLDAFSNVVLIVADASEPAALRYLAPYAGATVAEWFAYSGRSSLIVYDDLTRHAEAYRNLSLLLRRPPGRDAYPSDIFTAHAQLLERSFKLSDALGGGSVTALPIIETQRGNISDYIPTNLISITDGQLYLDAGLFAEGQLPAIDIGRSVSRVGASAQPQSMRDASANLRLDLAQYGDVKAFARFGAILDESTQRQLERGQCLMALLKQSERESVPITVEIAEFWALKSGMLDGVAPSSLLTFEKALLSRQGEFALLESALDGRIEGALEKNLRDWVQAAKGAL